MNFFFGTTVYTNPTKVKPLQGKVRGYHQTTMAHRDAELDN